MNSNDPTRANLFIPSIYTAGYTPSIYSVYLYCWVHRLFIPCTYSVWERRRLAGTCFFISIRKAKASWLASGAPHVPVGSQQQELHSTNLDRKYIIASLV